MKVCYIFSQSMYDRLEPTSPEDHELDVMMSVLQLQIVHAFHRKYQTGRVFH